MGDVVNMSGAAPAQPQQAPAKPEGLDQFYDGLKQATAAAFQTAAPFQGRHPAIENNLSEVLRYLELSNMYMDRLVLYVMNPGLLSKAGPPKEPQGG